MIKKGIQLKSPMRNYFSQIHSMVRLSPAGGYSPKILFITQNMEKYSVLTLQQHTAEIVEKPALLPQLDPISR